MFWHIRVNDVLALGIYLIEPSFGGIKPTINFSCKAWTWKSHPKSFIGDGSKISPRQEDGLIRPNNRHLFQSAK
jgi:hypothetical protein